MKLFPDPDETIEGVGRALRSGERTCVDVLESCLAQIDEWEPKVHAWVVVDRDGAMAQARALDEELSSERCRSPLHGIPLGIKDIIDVKGLPTAAGFAPWRDRIAGRDASIVAALRESGAVILGKTVTTQFAWIDPPVTRNPWDLNRTPGGSSSGSAAAVACGMCLGAIGTQTGGSIIRPASFCGVAGFKPGYNFIDFLEDSGGIVPFAPSLDHPGPIARSIRDLCLIAWMMVGVGEGVGDSRFAVEYWVKQVLRPPDKTPRFWRLRGYFDRRAEPAAVTAVDRVADALADAGAEVIEAAEDRFDFDALLAQHRHVMAAEAAEGHEARLAEYPHDYAPRIRALVEEGLALPAPTYIRSKRHLEESRMRSWHAERILWFDDAMDVLLMPATLGPAPDHSSTGDPTLNSPWSFLGWPALTTPIALSPEGLPLGLQLVGTSMGTNRKLISAAIWCEAVIRRASTRGREG